MALLNYTTSVPAEQTIGEIQKMLADYGVTAMMTEYEGRQVSAVSFRLNLDGKDMSFRLPCNWRAVATIFQTPAHRRRLRCRMDQIDEQAIRTAWRIIRDWVEAQLSLVQINMVTVPQIFLPYAIMADGRTLGEAMTEDPTMLLGGKP